MPLSLDGNKFPVQLSNKLSRFNAINLLVDQYKTRLPIRALKALTAINYRMRRLRKFGQKGAGYALDHRNDQLLPLKLNIEIGNKLGRLIFVRSFKNICETVKRSIFCVVKNVVKIDSISREGSFIKFAHSVECASTKYR